MNRTLAVLAAAALALTPFATHADDGKDRDDDREEQGEGSKGGVLVNSGVHKAYDQAFLGFGEKETPLALGLDYEASIKTWYNAEKGNVSSLVQLKYKLARGRNGRFQLFSCRSAEGAPRREKSESCGGGDADDDREGSASIQIKLVAMNDKALVNQEKSGVAAVVEARMLARSAGLLRGLFDAKEQKLNFCGGETKAGVARDSKEGGCQASVKEFSAIVRPFSECNRNAWLKNPRVGCRAVSLVRAIASDNQCLSLSAHSNGDAVAVTVEKAVAVERAAEMVAAPVERVAAVESVGGFYDGCLKSDGGGIGEIPREKTAVAVIAR